MDLGVSPTQPEKPRQANAWTRGWSHCPIGEVTSWDQLMGNDCFSSICRRLKCYQSRRNYQVFNISPGFSSKCPTCLFLEDEFEWWACVLSRAWWYLDGQAMSSVIQSVQGTLLKVPGRGPWSNLGMLVPMLLACCPHQLVSWHSFFTAQASGVGPEMMGKWKWIHQAKNLECDLNTTTRSYEKQVCFLKCKRPIRYFVECPPAKRSATQAGARQMVCNACMICSAFHSTVLLRHLFRRSGPKYHDNIIIKPCCIIFQDGNHWQPSHD